MARRLILWFLYGVVFAFLPAVFDFIGGKMYTDDPHVLHTIILRGDLLLGTVAVCVGALSQLEGKARKDHTGKAIAQAATIIFAVSAALLYASIVSRPVRHSEMAEQGTWWLLVLSLISGAICVSYAEDER